MSVALSLVSMFGKPVADELMKRLSKTNDGESKLGHVTKLLEDGASVIDALKKVFGRDYLAALNEIIKSQSASFSYEAGVPNYIKEEEPKSKNTVQVLKDELNINLDRLTVMDLKEGELSNQFKGLMSVWEQRCREAFKHEEEKKDIDSTFESMKKILNGDENNYKDIYRQLSSTAAGGFGALLIISGAMIATSTGVGVVTAVTTFFFGVPLLTVGALVIPGILIILLAKKAKPVHTVSISIAMAYKLLERIAKSRESRKNL